MLEYTEDRYIDEQNSYKRIESQVISFKTISPCESNTVVKQEKICCDQQGLTIIATFDNSINEYIQDHIVDTIKSTYKEFCSTNNLHCTFLTLFEVGTEDYNSNYDKIMKKCIKKFINTTNLSSLKNFTLNFNCIRPGTSKKLEAQNKSDGTVILYGNYQANREFIEKANLLAKDLNENFPTILKKKFPCKTFTRKLPTIWSTIGYFKNDFEISVDNKLYKTFKQWKDLKKNHQTLSQIQIKEFKMLRTPTKSLNCSELILPIINH